MSFVIISAYDVLYGPTMISTEDAGLHEQLTNEFNIPGVPYPALTISHRRGKRNKSAKLDKVIHKYETKLANCCDENTAEKIRGKVEELVQRKKDRMAINKETKINYDPHGKVIVFKVEDAPARVLNLLQYYGYKISTSGGGNDGFTWTLFNPGCQPKGIYPKLDELTTTD